MINLGTTEAGTPLEIDLDELVASRLYVEANSGGGKSWALRALLEQTHGHIQQFVIDVEGEFYSLRERGEYLLVGGENGDCPADPATAGVLARRLLETGASAILNLYDLSVGDPDHPETNERALFVRNFLTSMMTAPKSLWHPVLVVVDEAHLFAPEGRKCVSKRAVIELMSQGRKRPFCGVLATQKPTKISKDAIAEANNVLIGRAARPGDIRAAALELGLDSKESKVLKVLMPGEFYALGPAFKNENGIVRARIRQVLTTHPRPGKVAPPTPPARGRIREMLAELADLQVEAKNEVADLEAARAKIVLLEQRLAVANLPGDPVERIVEREKIVERIIYRVPERATLAMIRLAGEFQAAAAKISGASNDLLELSEGEPHEDVAAPPAVDVVAPTVRTNVQTSAPTPASAHAPASVKDGSLPSSARKILAALGGLPGGSGTDVAVGILTGIRLSSSTWRGGLAPLRARALIEESGNRLWLSPSGRARVGTVASVSKDIVATWRAKMDPPARKILDALVESRPKLLSKRDLFNRTGIDPRTSTWRAGMAQLRASGLIVEEGESMRISPHVP